MCDSTAASDSCQFKVSDNDFAVPPTPLLCRIGYGTGVGVYRLERGQEGGSPHSPWALKKVNRKFAHGDFAHRIKREAELLKDLRHPNIVGFRGFTTTPDGREVLAMEQCTVSLADMIEERSERDMGPFSAKQIMEVGRSLASALHYLHTNKHLIHGDIKSHNVLIKGDLEEIKLCDFGVSIEMNRDGVGKLEDYVGTGCWSAPETLGDGPLTEKSDMFSFGLVLWEMIGLTAPHLPDPDHVTSCTGSHTDTNSSFTLPQHKFGTRPEIPAGTVLGTDYDTVIDIFQRCTEANYSRRPSASQVLQLLSSSISW